MSRRNIEQQGEVGYQSTSRQPVRGPNLVFAEAAPRHLIRVSRKKETVEQNQRAVVERRTYFTRDELRARRHEQERLGCIGKLALGIEQNLPNRVTDRSATRLTQREARQPGN